MMFKEGQKVVCKYPSHFLKMGIVYTIKRITPQMILPESFELIEIPGKKFFSRAFINLKHRRGIYK